MTVQRCSFCNWSMNGNNFRKPEVFNHEQVVEATMNTEQIIVHDTDREENTKTVWMSSS